MKSHRFSRLLTWLSAVLVTAAIAAGPALAQAPRIAAASDLKFALDEIVAGFKRDTGLDITPVYGSSGNFRQQIAQGAPFEMFMSADEAFVFNLADEGRTVDRGELYAIGRIVLFAPHGSPLKPDTNFADLKAALADGRIARFAIANPEHAPYGRAAEQALAHQGLWDAMRTHLVLGENVSQAAQFATSGSAQGGIFALSLALAPQVAKLGTYVIDSGRMARRTGPAHGAHQGSGGNDAAVLQLRAGPARPRDLPAIRVRSAQRTGLIPHVDWTAFGLSLRLGALCVLVLLPIGVVLARVLAFRHFPGKGFAEAALALPLVLPPTVVGYYMLVTFGGATPLGRAYADLFGHSLVFSFQGLLLASVIVNLPFAVQPMQRAFEAIAPEVREAAAVSGMTPWRVLLRIDLPLAWPGIVTGLVLTFAHTLGEFGVVLMVGGSIPGETKTAAISIYDRVQAFDSAGAGAMSAALLVLSLIALGITYRLSSKVGRRRG